MMKVIVPKEEAKRIDYLLSHEPKDASECFGEDEIISYTAKYKDGMEMDIKLCGVQYEEGSSNLPWTEAVLFKDGTEVSCCEPSDEFFGKWMFWYNGNHYFCLVERGRD